MKGVVWNSDGFGDTSKHLAVHELIKENKLDFIAIIETGRSAFATPFLNFLAAGSDFVWYVIPPRGRSGGMLIGFNNASFLVQDEISGDFCIKFHLRSKEDGFCWALVVVYGAAQNDKKPEFLAELVRICDGETRPMLVGGDFNIIRRQEEKNNNNFDARWPTIFNAIIESLSLKDLNLSGRQFTWTSRRDTPTLEKLDRFLASVDWEQKYPLVTVHALNRAGSDHTPLLLDTGEQAFVGNASRFTFEFSWFKQEGFYDLVVREWNAIQVGNSPVEWWQNKIRHLRQFLRGWARNKSGEYKSLRDRLILLVN